MPALPENIRTFVAVELPEKLRAALVSRCEPARAALGRVLRWTLSENIHLTIKFLGDIHRNDITEAIDIIRESVSRLHCIPAEVFGPKPFPPEAKARLVVAPVQETAALKDIYNNLNRGFVKLGVKQENRGFLPHITLARSKDFQGKWASSFDWHALSGKIGMLPVTSLTFFMSELEPDGPTYTPLGRIEIG